MSIIERSTSYGVRVHLGGGKTRWVGSFPFEKYGGKRAAKTAAEEAEREAKKTRTRRRTNETCADFASRWPNDYAVVKRGPTRGRQKSDKTLANYRDDLKVFAAEFGPLPLAEIDRPLARKFAADHPRAAVTVRNMLSDATDDGLIDANPFLGLQIAESPGRKNYAPLTVEELHALAREAVGVHGAYGHQFAAYILAAGFIGFRLNEGLNLDWSDIDFKNSELTLRVTKLSKPRTVWLSPEAADALRSIPRQAHADHVFSGKRGNRLSKGNHQALWTPVRAAWWAKLSDQRKRELVDVDWHTLRHTCAHWIYVTLDMGSALAAFQLGHTDPALIEKRYGHPFEGALERLKRGARPAQIIPIRDASQTHAVGESA